MSSAAHMDFSAVDFTLSGQYAAMNVPYPIVENNLITVTRKDRHGGGARKYSRPPNGRKESANAKEDKKKRAQKKLVVEVAAPETPSVDVENGKFPYCLVWVPLPIVAWLVPFVGHVGICREDGVILDYAGNINIDNLAFGSTAKYVRLSRGKCCFPHPQSGHSCKDSNQHAMRGMAFSWDDAVSRSMQLFERKSYNFFTCNCHSFVANCLNRMAYAGSTDWNLVDVLLLALIKGQFVNFNGFLRAYVPFIVVMSFGLCMAGWAFFFFWCGFSFLLLGWFTYGTYAFGGYIDC